MHFKKIVKISAMILISMLLNIKELEFIPYGAKAEEELSIQSCGFLTSYETYRIVGELINTGNRVIGNIHLKILLYDSENELLFENVVRAELNVLNPGRATPFAYELTNKTIASLIHHLEVRVVNYTDVQPKEPLLKLYAYHDLGGINGEILNKGNSATRQVRIYAIFYDRNKKIVETSLDFINQLEPWEHEKYHIPYPPPDFWNITIFKRARYYSVVAESEDYIAESEVKMLEFSFPPFAIFSVTPGTNVSKGQTLTFNASNSFDLDGEIVNYWWDFGDGNKAEGKVVTHVYSENGNFNVQLIVMDNDGLKSTKTVLVKISGEERNYTWTLFMIFGVCVTISATALLAAIFIAKKSPHKKKIRKRSRKH